MESEALVKAKNLGKLYKDWEENQLVQSAEFSNDILPKLREMAGFDDPFGAKTFTHVGDDEDEDILDNNLSILEEIFWEGVYTG